jgi:hypothetical protein
LTAFVKKLGGYPRMPIHTIRIIEVYDELVIKGSLAANRGLEGIFNDNSLKEIARQASVNLLKGAVPSPCQRARSSRAPTRQTGRTAAMSA